MPFAGLALLSVAAAAVISPTPDAIYMLFIAAVILGVSGLAYWLGWKRSRNER